LVELSFRITVDNRAIKKAAISIIAAFFSYFETFEKAKIGLLDLSLPARRNG
jgi:hypothetical protein